MRESHAYGTHSECCSILFVCATVKTEPQQTIKIKTEGKRREGRRKGYKKLHNGFASIQMNKIFLWGKVNECNFIRLHFFKFLFIYITCGFQQIFFVIRVYFGKNS